MRRARSISARSSCGAIAPTTFSVIWSCNAKISSSTPSYRSAQWCAPLAASISCPVIRTRFRSLRQLPSST
ncbi:Uncharacterised protein [Bordetella pertussis]|nr:Uncharacterised protein [Bordetella pertussis]